MSAYEREQGTVLSGWPRLRLSLPLLRLRAVGSGATVRHVCTADQHRQADQLARGAVTNRLVNGHTPFVPGTCPPLCASSKEPTIKFPRQQLLGSHCGMSVTINIWKMPMLCFRLRQAPLPSCHVKMPAGKVTPRVGGLVMLPVVIWPSKLNLSWAQVVCDFSESLPVFFCVPSFPGYTGHSVRHLGGWIRQHHDGGCAG